MNMNLYAQFASHFPEDTGTAALVDKNGILATYGDLESASARLANTLIGLGASRGDRVTVQVGKSVDALYLYLGVLRAGLVFHPLNTAYQKSELAYFLENAEPAVIIGDDNTVATLSELAQDTSIVLDIAELVTMASETSDTFETANSADEDLAALLYSSGTTGIPKGIQLTHGNLLSNTQTLVESWAFTSDDILLHALPIFHVHGLFVAIGCALLSGSKMHWLNGFDAAEIIKALPTCSVMMGVPTFYTRLLASDDFSRSVTENMRLFISGSAPLLAETFDAFEARTGQRILERYGMTETGMNTSNPLNGDRIAGTVGPPLPGVEIRVVGEDNTVLAAGEPGAVQVRGPNVFHGYWKLPDKTAEDFTSDKFFNTGDQGVIDERGYLSIIGREKDMIISGGLNIYPKEIELLLDQLDGVLESAVVGVAHDDFGEGVVAAIVETTPGSLREDEIIAAVKSEIAAFKVPKAIVFLDELPRNAMGKVQKKQLREEFSNLLTMKT